MTDLTPDLIIRLRADYEAGDSIATVSGRHEVPRHIVNRIVTDLIRPNPVAPTVLCAVCDEKTPKGRKYCGADCAKAGIHQRNKDRMDEFLWIAGTDSGENIASRLGFANRQRLIDWLRKHGQIVWADRISSETIRDSTKQWAA